MSDDPIAAARAALQAGEAQQALVHLRDVFHYPGPEDPAPLRAGLEVLAEVGRVMGDPELPQRIQACLAPDADSEAWYQVGYQMIEVGLEGYAAAVLEQALRLAPGSLPVVSELAAALERSLDFAAVRSLLREHPALLATEFLPNYLLAFNAVMCGDLEEPAELLPKLRELSGDDERRHFMVHRIEAVLARAAAISGVSSLDAADLRGWHWVITGGLLTHRSPHGLDAGMNGRYALLQGSPGLARLGVERLLCVLETWGLDVPGVVPLPERGAQILAHAVAERLGKPVLPFPEQGPEGPALIVGHDLHRVDGPALRPLVTRQPGQLLWVHATCWTEHFPIAPDVTTLLYQQLTPFHGQQMIVDPETKTVGRSEADERPPEQVAADVLAGEVHAEDDDPADLAHLEALAKAVGAQHVREGGRREAMWFGSPVGSLRFL